MFLLVWMKIFETWHKLIVSITHLPRVSSFIFFIIFLRHLFSHFSILLQLHITVITRLTTYTITYITTSPTHPPLHPQTPWQRTFEGTNKQQVSHTNLLSTFLQNSHHLKNSASPIRQIRQSYGYLRLFSSNKNSFILAVIF